MRRLAFLTAALCLAACRNAPIDTQDVLGTWGGANARLVLEDSLGTIEYDCAHGTIARGWTVSTSGEFHGTGRHVQETGGPSFSGDTLSRPARYDGSIDGNSLNLTVTLTDSAKLLGTFVLKHNSNGSVFKCLTL